MGAEVTWKVLVLRVQEDWVEVDAVISSEAAEEARKLPGVISVVKVSRDFAKDEDEF